MQIDRERVYGDFDKLGPRECQSPAPWHRLSYPRPMPGEGYPPARPLEQRRVGMTSEEHGALGKLIAHMDDAAAELPAASAWRSRIVAFTCALRAACHLRPAEALPGQLDASPARARVGGLRMIDGGRS